MTEEGEPEKRNPPNRLQVRNFQRHVKVDTRGLRAFLKRVARELSRADAVTTLVLVGDERMRAINRIFRGYDRTTDVLSFATGPSVAPEEESYLGDIVISVETARRQALRRGSNLPRELKVLALHGFLHLLGYDHDSDGGEMRRIEYRLRRRFQITRPRPNPTASTRRKARKK
jgi:probable rRNA maturation factor